MRIKNNQFNKWLKKSDYEFVPMQVGETVVSLDPGVYRPDYSDALGSYYFHRKDFNTEDLIVLPSSKHQEIFRSIRRFLECKELYKKNGFFFKRGILLHGRPGSGKTCLINLICKHVIEHLGAVVITISNHPEVEMFTSELSSVLRQIEPDRLIIIVFEDLDGLCQGSTETMVLNLLDGVNQLENVIYLGSTNYIENLKERVINRPSRFDDRIYVPFLSPEDREVYFRYKIPEDVIATIDLPEWVSKTDGMSFAHLAELIKSHLILGVSFDDTIKKLEEMNNFKGESSAKYEKKSGIGYNSGVKQNV